MKFNKVYDGKYTSENGRFEIVRYGGIWEVYDNSKEQPVYRCGKLIRYTSLYLGYTNTLRAAKELCFK